MATYDIAQELAWQKVTRQVTFSTDSYRRGTNSFSSKNTDRPEACLVCSVIPLAWSLLFA